jgi:predicted PurR-regulated permease PerM
MSTDGEGRADVARGLAGRLRAAAAESTRRSGALLRGRLAGEGRVGAHSPGSALPPDSVPRAESAPPSAVATVPRPVPDDASDQPPPVADANGAGRASADDTPSDVARDGGRPADPGSSASPADPGSSASPTGSTGPAEDAAGSGDPVAGDGADRRLGPAILRAADMHVPQTLRNAAAWAWRLLLVAALVYFAFKVAVALRLLVLPFIAAVLLCALLQPLAGRLTTAGMPRLAATWVTLLTAIAVLAGVGILITNQVQAGYPQLKAEVLHTVSSVLHYLSGPPFRLNGARLDKLTSRLVTYLSQHRTLVLGTVLTGGKYFIEVLAGVILTIFITFFLLKDGDLLWARLMRGFIRFRGAGPEAIERSDRASGAAWHALVKYIHGTTIIAVIHATIIGIALWLLGVPLIMPLAILVFIAAYIPLVGILVVGALAILVTLATQGWVAAAILLAIFLAENQLESHLLQPLVIGRAVKLHPLEVIIVLAVGGIVAGIPGAIVAVPTAAVISAAWRSTQEQGRPSRQARSSRPVKSGPPAESGRPE